MGGSVFNRDQAQAYAQGGVPGGLLAPEDCRSFTDCAAGSRLNNGGIQLVLCLFFQSSAQADADGRVLSAALQMSTTTMEMTPACFLTLGQLQRLRQASSHREPPTLSARPPMPFRYSPDSAA